MVNHSDLATPTDRGQESTKPSADPNTLDTLELPPLYDAEIWAYLDRAAHAMVNTFED